MKNLPAFLLYFFTVLSANSQAQEPTSQGTFSIFLSSESCQTDLSHEHVYEEVVDSVKGLRIIKANGIPAHKTGTFPNNGNPNTIRPQEMTYTIPLNPEPLEKSVPGMGIRTGILFSGVELDPFTGEFFIGNNGANRAWNITTLTTTVDLGLDCNNAHVQPSGKYHYHGTPNAYLDDLGVDGTEMVKVGYAADGYPIYYKFAYNDSGEIQAYESGYALKEGNRPGDGKTAPDGVYDGTYFQDYEYREGLSDLDECNGRIGKTPESESEYYYLITDNFPSVPICLHAQPSNDFSTHAAGQAPPMAGRNQRGMPDRRSENRQGPPDPQEIMKMLDLDQDDRIARSEARGPLQNDFDHFDSNKDGYLTLEELKNNRPR